MAKQNLKYRRLQTLTKGKTTVVIAHRLSTILNSNNIYVIDSGKVVDNGQHHELIVKSELYKNFMKSRYKNNYVFCTNLLLHYFTLYLSFFFRVLKKKRYIRSIKEKFTFL